MTLLVAIRLPGIRTRIAALLAGLYVMSAAAIYPAVSGEISPEAVWPLLSGIGLAMFIGTSLAMLIFRSAASKGRDKSGR